MSAPVRLDVWLWAARFFKTRALAKQAIDGGKVEVDEAHGKPGRSVQPGQRLRISRGEERFEVEVLALSGKRGPAEHAQTLYQETAASVAERERLREMRSAGGISVDHPVKRPDKHARRQLRETKHGRS